MIEPLKLPGERRRKVLVQLDLHARGGRQRTRGDSSEGAIVAIAMRTVGTRRDAKRMA
jgi:hypothetical protein